MIGLNEAMAALDAPTGVLMLVWFLTQAWALFMIFIVFILRVLSIIFSL